MNKFLKFLNKYWIVISISATIVGSIVTGGLHLKGRIDSDEDILNDTKVWVNEHDDNISDHEHRITRLEALQEARDRQCK